MSYSSLAGFRDDWDIFKMKSYRRETSTWFGVLLTFVGLPLGTALLLYFHIVAEAKVPYTTTSTTSISRDLLGGDDGNYNSLGAVCRAPGGCMLFVRYTKRAHTEKCTESPLAGEGFQWAFVAHGEELTPAPFVCYSPIAKDGIFVAWLRYPPHHRCAEIADHLDGPAAAAARKQCAATFLQAAAAKSWFPCPNLVTANGPKPQNFDTGLSCYDPQGMWPEFYGPQRESGKKAIVDTNLECKNIDLSCADFPFGFGLRTPAIASLTEAQASVQQVCDKVEGGFMPDEAPVLYGSHLIQTQKLRISGFDCKFDAPPGHDAAEKTEWAYFSSTIQLTTTDGLVPPNQQLPYEPDSAGSSTHGDWAALIPKLDTLFEEIYCSPPKVCDHNWLARHWSPCRAGRCPG